MITANPQTQQIRQGDVLLTRIPAPPVTEAARAKDESGQPLAGLLVPGERTGHAHRLPARVYDAPGVGRVLMLERPQVLTHEEHEHIEVPAGWWVPTFQREYRPRRQFRSRSRVD
jgi:hypothetical protein